MKLDEFKKLLRPMIKNMVKEVLLEEGVLSSIVTEVASGLLVSENRKRPQRSEAVEIQRQELEGQKMMEQMKRSRPMVFENTTPATEARPGAPLSDMDPNDPGVDISSIVGMSGGNWTKLM